MGNTTEIAVNTETWTQVATGAAKGYITNDGIVKLLYRENNSLPAPSDNIAHTLEKDVGAYVSFNVVVGQNVYVKSVDKDSKVAVTLV
jgi:hypothetical protein